MPESEAPQPLDPPMVPFAAIGIVVWALLGMILWAAGRSGWAQICLAGVLWGFVGLAAMLKHDANRRRASATNGRPAQEGSDSTSPSS